MNVGDMAFANADGYPNNSDMLDAENSDRSDLLGASAGKVDLNFFNSFGIFALPSAFEASLFSTYPSPMADETEPVRLNSEASKSRDLIRVSQGANLLTPSCNQINQKTKPNSSSASQSPAPAGKRRLYRPRRQNRSCDPCRSAKRACDLPPNRHPLEQFTLSPCSMCKVRGTICTVAWRASKQSSYNTKKLASSTKHHFPHNDTDLANEHTGDDPLHTTPSRYDCDLVYRTIASQTCYQKLGAYIDIFDIPMSKLLSEKCMPPCYSFGIAALAPLRRNPQLAAGFYQVELCIMKSWEMGPFSRQLTSARSRLFLTASILDLLFQRSDSSSGYVRLSRDIALADTHKWVAIAAGSQFSVNENDFQNKEKFRERARDIAYTTWLKAKHMIFDNIAASKSFRLGLSLLLFGTILPPTGTDQSRDYEEDAAYALQKGITRLKILCAEARTYLQDDACSSVITPLVGRHSPVQKQCLFQCLSQEAHESILELIAAFEWLVEMSQGVATALFPSRGVTVIPTFDKSNHNKTSFKEELCQNSDVKGADNGQDSIPMDDAIIARVKAAARPVTVLWTQGSAEQPLRIALLESASLVVLMWKILSRLTIATENLSAGQVKHTEIHQNFKQMIMLVDLWRTTFGTIDYFSAMILQQLTADVRRCVIFCAFDGDLAVLLFCELSIRLQSYLSNQSLLSGNSLRERLALNKCYRNCQRITSAMQISYLASANHGVSSPGFQGKFGLKANIEDIRAHPVSAT